jgi:hypothetical protein
MIPLLACYELAVERASARNVAEIWLTAPIELVARPLGWSAALARLGGLCALAIAALWRVFHGELALGRRLWRTVLEGVLGAVLLGPVLVALLALLGPEAPAFAGAGGQASLERAALIAGGAAYEELLFRVGLQSIVFVLALYAAGALGADDRGRPARLCADVASLGLSAFVFAAAHLASFAEAFGAAAIDRGSSVQGAPDAPSSIGGEVFEPAVFTWRFLAGILLGCLFRWRGPGVAAWSHGLFNVALLIGAGPDVFL